MILCRSADHGRATNVDILNSGVVVAALEADFFKWVEIDDGQIDAANAVGFHCSNVFRVVAHCKQAAVNRWVQRLYASVHDFREAGDFRNVLYRNAFCGNRLGGAAGREDFNAMGMECLGEIDEAGLVGHGKEGAAHPMKIGSGNMLGADSHRKRSLRC